MPFSEARSKLAQVDYHLSRLRDAHRRSNENEIKWELSSLQNASYSVMQRMLYDAAETLNLGITREQYLDEFLFSKLARKRDIPMAVNFIDWWKERIKELDGNTVWRLRDIDTHRGDTTLQQDMVTIFVSGYSSVETSDQRYVASYVASQMSSRVYQWGPPIPEWRTLEQSKIYHIKGSSQTVLDDASRLKERLNEIVDEAEKMCVT